MQLLWVHQGQVKGRYHHVLFGILICATSQVEICSEQRLPASQNTHITNVLYVACGIEAEKYITTGKLAPDTLMVDLILSQLQKLPSGTNWLLDGFPRSLGQAESLSEKEKVDFVINLDVPFDTICERLSGRWTHLPSGRVYNVGFNPPKVAGIDDITGEPLVQREDDKIETVHKRLQTYQTQTLPLLEFYRKRNILHSYSGTKTDEIWPNVKAFLETILVDPKQRRHA
ncbi:GTP:AMP phosphotransferase AK3, mitochondrial-like isoform X2 [Clavelina lepadiformis]|uniref:GTP:AMP phosphotransferase AK3, mitochondrial-like isoform X2 n=1 Tax=Clavelina lepadiformis TaxID=159417 RepID=UPI00404272D2